MGEFIVDFYCQQLALVIEINDGVHLNQKEYDSNRQSILESRGLHILRFTNDAVITDKQGVLELIKQACKDRLKET